MNKESIIEDKNAIKAGQIYQWEFSQHIVHILDIIDFKANKDIDMYEVKLVITFEEGDNGDQYHCAWDYDEIDLNIMNGYLILTGEF